MYKKVILIIFFLLSQNFYVFGQLKFDKTNVNFGVIKQNTSVQTVFYYTNKSENKITIKNIYSTCGCTIPVNYKKLLNPGEYGKVDVVFNSEQFKGNVIRKIYFETVPAIQPIPELTVKSTVVEEFSFSPKMITGSSSSKSKVITKYIRITSNFYKKFKIVDVKYNKKYFKVTVSKTSSNKYNARVNIFVDKIKSVNRFQEKIMFVFLVNKKKIKKYLYVYI